MTGPQTKAFWRAFSAACSAQGLETKDQREAYRKQAMVEELGIEHLSQVDSGRGYDRLMARINSDAGDYARAAEYLINDARKIARCVEDCAEQIAGLSPTVTDAIHYIGGILRQSNLSPLGADGNEFWMDIPTESLRVIFQILDTQRRRLLRQAGYHGRVRYVYGQRWQLSGISGRVDPVPNSGSAARSRFKVHF